MTEAAILPFVRNAWYLAAWADELDDVLLGRTFMDQPVVLYRDATGKVGALEDRCCHRGAPLTHGAVVEAGLQCGYHGLIYDTDGKCVVVPGQKNVPKDARIRSFPVVERNKNVWIWMGDPALADEGQDCRLPLSRRHEEVAPPQERLSHQGELPVHDRQPDGPYPSGIYPSPYDRRSAERPRRGRDGDQADRDRRLFHPLDART